MMAEPITIALVAVSCLIGLGVATTAGLKAFRAWIEFKRYELAQVSSDPEFAPTTGRIEIADLRERVKKLEAIAAGIDP